MTDLNMGHQPPLIFSHYGYSEYLKYTLSCARHTNPTRRLILLGDLQNEDVARNAGWDHYDYSQYGGPLRDEFNSCFRHIHGKDFNPIRNGKDWLKYVFDRWFCIESFLLREDIEEFWHFDSDTMILHDLGKYEYLRKKYDFSVQCNGMCLNGFGSHGIVEEFCNYILVLFKDVGFLAGQQQEFDTSHPQWAFSEMRAFQEYMHQNTCRLHIHLLNLPNNIAFDDCLGQEHGFSMCRLTTGQNIKLIKVEKGKFYGFRDEKVEFASLNLSLLGEHVFQWVLKNLDCSSHSTINDALPMKENILTSVVRKLRRILMCRPQ